jgi:hypothetical protein
MSDISIKNIENLTVPQIQSMVNQGGKFVIFQYTISILVMTFKRSSDIYFIKPGEGTIGYSWGFTLINLILGWWGIPWGPIYTIGALFTNLGGGKDFTSEVMHDLLTRHAQQTATTQMPSYNVPGTPPANNNNNNNSPYNIP